MEKNVRLRILLVMEILFERTDAVHGVSMQDILFCLKQNQISGERKSVYEDIHALQEYGLEILYFQEDKTYRLMERTMELAELKLFVDAIRASKFITKEKEDQMIRHVEEMASRYQRNELQRAVFSEKPKSIHPFFLQSMDALHSAIAQNRQVTFRYYVWNLDKKLEEKHAGKLYRVSPWRMVWAEENYYLVAFDSETLKFHRFRVDKISDVMLHTDLREGEAAFQKLDVINYSASHFGMHDGEEKRVSVEFENELINVVLDRFGTEIQLIKTDAKHFKTALPVVVSSQFFGWICGLGKQVKILTKEVAEEYRQYLMDSLERYP